MGDTGFNMNELPSGNVAVVIEHNAFRIIITISSNTEIKS